MSISEGYGDYLVFHYDGTNKSPASKSEYEQFYQFYEKARREHLFEQKQIDTDSFYEFLRKNVKEIHPDLEICFIPRSLFELAFIKQAINEEIKAKKKCSLRNSDNRDIYIQALGTINAENSRLSKCWHLCHHNPGGFTTKNPQDQSNQQNNAIELSFRLNNKLLKNLPKEEILLTQKKIQHIADKYLGFLKNLHESTNSSLAKEAGKLASCSPPGPLTNFHCESTRGGIKPLGIRNDNDAAIIKKAIDLECEKGKDSIFLYRGIEDYYCSDSIETSTGTPLSLSYGTSLFAGVLYDGGATAYHYIRNSNWGGYILVIPKDEIRNSPFHIPSSSTIESLSGEGELFHARSKWWATRSRVEGFGEGYREDETSLPIVNQLISTKSKEELKEQFNHYMQNNKTPLT